MGSRAVRIMLKDLLPAGLSIPTSSLTIDKVIKRFVRKVMG
jgi:hypothetical protein